MSREEQLPQLLMNFFSYESKNDALLWKYIGNPPVHKHISSFPQHGERVQHVNRNRISLTPPLTSHRVFQKLLCERTPGLPKMGRAE